MTYPTTAPCRRTYRWIQAYCAIRISTSVGDRLRNQVGATGSIAAIPTAALSSRFSGNELGEAMRLVALAQQNSGRRSNHENYRNSP